MVYLKVEKNKIKIKILLKKQMSICVKLSFKQPFFMAVAKALKAPYIKVASLQQQT